MDGAAAAEPSQELIAAILEARAGPPHTMRN